MMMVKFSGLVRIIAGAELKYMSERRDEEEQQFQEKFFGSAHAEKEWNYE